MTALVQIPVGVLVDRIKADSQWIDYTWQPSAVLVGQPETQAWTRISGDAERTTFYAGGATIGLHRSSTAYYRDNLAGDCVLWVILSPTGVEPPYQLVGVTADPTEGEGLTEAGSHVIECVPMPPQIRDVVEAFIAEHHVEQPFFKRKRDRADPEALGRRGPDIKNEPKA